MPKTTEVIALSLQIFERSLHSLIYAENKDLDHYKTLIFFQLWVVSNCDLTYGAVQRYKYVEELIQAGLPVERFGKCFNNKKVFDNMSPEDRQSYKFYLSFENALHCKDYITEKFWTNALSEGRVPIVWGPSKEDLVRLAPTNSFIHVEDFDSPSALAKYIDYLNRNDTAYREYFQWIENPDKKTLKIIEYHSVDYYQRLCDFVRCWNGVSTTVASVTEYFKNETKSCFFPK